MKVTVRCMSLSRIGRKQRLLMQNKKLPSVNQPPHKHKPGLALALCFFCLTTACSLGPASSAAEPRQPIRSPYPTFTPTIVSSVPADNVAPVANEVAPTATTAEVVAAVATVAPTPTLPFATEAPTVAPTAAPPRLVVTAPLANVRSGPGTTYTVLTTVERGQEYDIIGKNVAGDWWRFCCVDGQPAWIINELVDVEGAVELAPVSEEVVQVSATATPAPASSQATAAATQPPAAAPAQPPAAPAADFAFELVSSEQFSEPKLVRVFLYVYDGEKALEGYTMRVKKDGADMPVNGKSAGGQPSFTWPIADARQRFQNLKAEFPNVAPAGVWEVQLVDGSGNPVGPPVAFTLVANEPNQELYVRYKKR